MREDPATLPAWKPSLCNDCAYSATTPPFNIAGKVATMAPEESMTLKAEMKLPVCARDTPPNQCGPGLTS